jgi:hypothetical protein
LNLFIKVIEDLQDFALALILPLHELLLLLGLVLPKLLDNHLRLCSKLLVQKLFIPLTVLVSYRILQFLEVAIFNFAPLISIETKLLLMIIVVIGQVDVHISP